ncbi:hypothetical protein [Flavobacterium sp.]|uniref:hypothetical protein n=1 Tax=Flavobacterium sp. TaxID=239 RepID=UPI00404767B6
MKRIKFDNLSENWRLKLLVICSIIFLFLGIFEISVFNDSTLNESFIKIGFLFQVLFFGRMFVYKNYVQWNNKGIYIKVNRFFGTNLNFDDIKSINYQDNSILIKKYNNKEIVINLSNIQSSDTLYLFEIIQINSNKTT